MVCVVVFTSCWVPLFVSVKGHDTCTEEKGKVCSGVFSIMTLFSVISWSFFLSQLLSLVGLVYIFFLIVLPFTRLCMERWLLFFHVFFPSLYNFSFLKVLYHRWILMIVIEEPRSL